MIRAAAIVICLLVLGDTVEQALALPVPGSAIGLLALSLLLAVQGGQDEGFSTLFDFASPYFPLFFVPAAVGAVANFEALLGAWLEVVLAVVFGTALVLIGTGLIAQSLMTRSRTDVRP